MPRRRVHRSSPVAPAPRCEECGSDDLDEVPQWLFGGRDTQADAGSRAVVVCGWCDRKQGPR